VRDLVSAATKIGRSVVRRVCGKNMMKGNNQREQRMLIQDIKLRKFACGGALR
jgi:hypothetical protein